MSVGLLSDRKHLGVDFISSAEVIKHGTYPSRCITTAV